MYSKQYLTYRMVPCLVSLIDVYASRGFVSISSSFVCLYIVTVKLSLSCTVSDVVPLVCPLTVFVTKNDHEKYSVRTPRYAMCSEVA